MAEFLTDISTLRERAREHIAAGPVTDAYGADLARVIQVCQEALATELVCILRYQRHYWTARGLDWPQISAKFAHFAAEEEQHRDKLAHRITQLGGAPDFDPAVLAGRSHTEYGSSLDLEAMLLEDLVAERVAILSYSEIKAWLGDADPVTESLFSDLLKEETDHAGDLARLLVALPEAQAWAAEQQADDTDQNQDGGEGQGERIDPALIMGEEGLAVHAADPAVPGSIP